MKYFITVLMIILFANFSNAQSNDYSSLWKKVEKLETEGLPKSALDIVQQITDQAKKENNTPQIIKALLYKSKYALVLEEDAQLKIINGFKAEIKTSETPTKNVLENMLATLYWQYFEQNRYQFYNRTNTENKVDADDFRTWDLQTLFNEIHLHYQNSLENGLILQTTKLDDYKAIIHEQKDSKIYRPTLFDLLNHNALQFYKTDENSITQPAYKFEIDNPDFLSDGSTFSVLNIESKDSTSLQLHALKIYKSLLRFHSTDASPYAFVDVDIERLQFVSQNTTLDNKEALLLETLKAESKRWKDAKVDVSALYDFEIASIYRQQGQNYNPETNVEPRWKIKDALDICNTVISQYPNSKGAEKCKVLKSQILQSNLQLTAENTLPIQQNALVLINYTNIEALQFKVYHISDSQREALNKTYRQDEQLAFFKKLKVAKEWQSNLRNENDYQSHSTEIVLPKLDNGHYVIFANYGNEKNSFAYKTIQVTTIALVANTSYEKEIFQVINRNNGQPLVGAQVKITYQTNYNGNYETKNLVANKKGEIEFEKSNNRYYNIDVEVKYNGETANFDNYYINGYYNRNDNTNNTTYNAFLFTDRSIYRPGQVVYFKGIVMSTKEGASSVMPNELIEATLYDVNGEELKKIELKTNEFGSIASEFILPNSGLTGQFNIELHSKNISFYAHSNFSVEEYKRPKFETKFNPVTETFKVNDSVTVKGNALAYAGSNITDAKVVYRVHRKVQYPSWYYWYRPWFNSEPQEITHGETITDASGNFEVTFKAIPDESVDKTSLPIFNYEITADVTDVNGETRSATTVVNVGYHALTANITVANQLDKTKKDHKLSIDTKNLNGEFVPATGTIKIYKLVAPQSALRPRPWSAPDYKSMTKDEFKRLFPHEAYDDEHNADTWKKGKLVLEQKFDTSKSKTLELGNIKKWESGQYVIVLESKDKFGQLVKDEVKTSLYSDNDNTLADHQLFSVTTDKSNYKTGENVILTFGSAAENITITVDIEKNQKIINTYIIPLSNNKKTIAIPVNKDDVGGFAVHYSCAVYNTFQSGTELISVPYPKTDLEIETTTFRDKLQPGTDETWSFKVKGPKGDKVSAELLASMYDASLDQFTTHSWSFNPLYKSTYNSYSRRNANRSFGTSNFRVYNDDQRYFSYPTQNYDQLNWFGFYLSDNNQYRRQYLNSLYANIPSSYTSSKKDSIKDGNIKGIILDENGLVLPGVIIIAKDSTNGVQSDFDGNFSINAKDNTNLVFSFLGYKSLEIKINNFNYLIVTLIPDYSQLDEIVVVGFSTKSRDELTSAVSNMYVEDAMMKVSTSEMKDSAGNAGFVDEGYIQNKEKENLQQNISEKQESFDNVTIRKNLQETAFFFPQLQTDAEGNVSFNFTTPEALTKWKLQLLAHTKTLESATKTLETVTQKELMVIPNAPRFLRQGDQITISTKIANLTDKQLLGQAKLELTDAMTGKDISQVLVMSSAVETFSLDAKGNTQVSWNLTIPDDVDAIQYKIIAKSGDFSDGEQNALPVLTNRMLVTETLPMWIRSNETRTFTLDKLKTNTSTTLKHHKLTLEMTSNPAWYAVQALPYLMEYPYECNEQTFSRFYANALASHIANSNPRIQEVFNQWKNTDALISNLEKNEELKSILIQETPWLRDAQSETEQKKRIALLFDLNKMNNELQSAKRKLENNQMSNGAWPWFEGGRPNRYITQHIITGFTHLNHLTNASGKIETSQMVNKAIAYLDDEFVQEYKDIRKYNAKADLSKEHLSSTQLQFMYMRSFMPDTKTSKEVKEVMDYYHSQIKKYWLNKPLYSKGLMALVMHRMGDKKTAAKILKSLKENSITNDELGMYWKENTSSWYWYQAPIETQALMIEAFSEIENDTKTVDNLKIWLLKNKQTNSWKTTKATTEAVYALLLQGSDWLSVTEAVDVLVGNKNIEPSKLDNVKVEAGTGYYKTSWNSSEIKPEMATVKLTKKGNGIAWGSLYWQYFEDLDKITSAETPLKLKKKLFLKTNTDKGEQISEITEATALKVGDLVRVRIELRSDRDMEFIHMKDMRAAGFEPVNVLSQYKWQDGLGYYEATKDASTNFFFDYLPKGIYVFEYDLRVNNAGNMSNGITTIQSMYAPEFSSHSEGIRVKVD